MSHRSSVVRRLFACCVVSCLAGLQGLEVLTGMLDSDMQLSASLVDVPEEADFSAQLPAFDTSAIEPSKMSPTCNDKKWGYQRLHYSTVKNAEQVHDDQVFDPQDDGTIIIRQPGLLEVSASLLGSGLEKYTLIVGSSVNASTNEALGDTGLPPKGSAAEDSSRSKGACDASLDGFSLGSPGKDEGEVVATRWIEAHAGYKLVLATVLFPGKYWRVEGGELHIKWRPLQTGTCHAEQVTLTHWGACYRLDKSEPFLVEGARKVEAMGIKTLKTTLSRAAGPSPDDESEKVWADLPEKYTITDLAKHSVFRTLFGMDFTHYVLVAYTTAVTWDANYYRSYGMTEKNTEKETAQMKELVEHLLTEYKGTGKTFVLQNWEGDNVLEGGYNRLTDPAKTKMKTKTEVQKGMIDWIRARQAGVDAARNNATVNNSDVTVLHAVEACKVWEPFENKQGENEGQWIATQVLPYVQVDMASYSAYDSQRKFQFPQVLDFLNASLRPTEYVKRTPYGAYPTFIGEYGMAEVLFNKDASRIQPLMRMVVEACLQRNCPFAIYWQMYGNELLTNNDHENSCDAWDRENNSGIDGMKGFWVYRPDGSTWPLMYNLLHGYTKNC